MGKSINRVWINGWIDIAIKPSSKLSPCLIARLDLTYGLVATLQESLPDVHPCKISQNYKKPKKRQWKVPKQTITLQKILNPFFLWQLSRIK